MRFAFRLAKELGLANPYAMRRSMPAWLLTEWMAFFELEPFGDLQHDWRAGVLASVIVNSNPYASGSPRRPEDFFPHLKAGREQRQTAKQAAAAGKRWAQAAAAEAKRREH